MSFVDKTLECRDCETAFTFSAEEQEFFASKGYINDPGRCLPCREARKAQRPVSGGYGSYRQARQMFPAVCADCGKDTQVPFQPREDRPVYCSDCYNKVRLNSRR
jgi:CxxC-x17-CxxC domain-containing protein